MENMRKHWDITFVTTINWSKKDLFNVATKPPYNIFFSDNVLAM